MIRHRTVRGALGAAAIAASLALPAFARAALTVDTSFNPTDIGGIVGLAYEPSSNSVWVYPDSGTTIRRYSTTGAFLSSVNRPGESADDADLEIAPQAFTLGTTLVPAGSLLFTNGESGPAEVYAIDPVTGTVLSTLNTTFGASHVVGGAYHAGRNTLFLVQDRQPSASAADNVVAEIDPLTGAILNSFKVDTALPGFTVNFGDIEVSATTGNLYVVSSDESSLAEFTPTGTFVQLLNLPAGVSGLAGIGLDDANSAAWVTSSSGTISRLTGVPEPTAAALLLAGPAIIARRRARP